MRIAEAPLPARSPLAAALLATLILLPGPLAASASGPAAPAAPAEPAPAAPESAGARLARDFKHFYTDGAPALLVGLGGAAALANSSADENFRDWYQDSVRDDTTDSAAEGAKLLGEGGIVIPLTAAAYLYTRLGHGERGGAGGWPERTLRAFVVGAAPLLVLQSAIGASRPSDGLGSDWDPFNDTNGASGHAFIGSVPFLTAARMSHHGAAKGALYFASTLAAWSRVNDDQHYASQAALGWWLGYLATRAVNRSEAAPRVALAPLATRAGVGVGMTVRLGRR